MLSCVIIAKNTASSIQKTIESVSFADEIIVVDDNSTDRTRETAKKAGAQVLIHSLDGNFAQQRNYGMSRTTGEWVLFIDTDEILTEELQNEILKLSDAKALAGRQVRDDRKDIAVYYIKRRDYFWGTEMKYGETRAARTKGFIRLVRRGAGTWKGRVHEAFITNKRVGTLGGFIDHYPHQSIADFLHSINSYSTIRVQELDMTGYNSSVVAILFIPPSKFLYTYLVRLGFLDGPAGFVYSFMMSFHSFLVWSKLYLLIQKGKQTS